MGTPHDPQPSYRASPDAWQTKVQVAFRLPFPLPWLLISSVLFGLGCAIVALAENDLHAVRLLALDAILIAAIANAVVLFERFLDALADCFPALIDEEPSKTQDWLRRWYDTIFWSRKNLLVGLLLGVLCIPAGSPAITGSFASLAGRAYAYMLVFVIGLLGGSMLWTMIGIARVMFSLGGEMNIKPSIFDSETSALRAASAVLWKVTMVASLVYLLGLSRYVFMSLVAGPTALVVISVAGCFIVYYFIGPQWNIHKTLRRLKGHRLSLLVSQIERTFDEVTDEPTPEKINQLRELFDLQRLVDRKRSWSFGTGELLMLIGTVLIPLVIFAFDFFLRGGAKP